MNKTLHIICFDLPFPANYGGAIDMYYKIRSLAENGAQIYLHVFEYGRGEQENLKKYCKEVFYYKRKTSFIKSIGIAPYIVSSRSSDKLIANLKKVDAPILFEGLHSTWALRKKIFKDRALFVRTHNIEHRYYRQLAQNEPNFLKKLYYLVESSRLRNYEKVLKHCDHIFSISKEETNYFNKTFGDKVTYLPPFHPNKKLHELSKKGYFALFHGNLSVYDNLKAAYFIIDVFKTLSYPLVLAGESADKKLMQKIDQYKNISFISIPDNEKLLELFHRAHLNVLYSHIDSGVKIKLINALFQSRFVLANYKATKGSGLDSLCVTANNRKDITNQVIRLFDREFSENELALRREMLGTFDNRTNAEKLLEFL